MAPFVGILALLIFAILITVALTRWLLRINDAIDRLDKIESHLRDIAKNIKKE
jgi:type II secretory pathway pseudopilin PulG